MEELLVLVLRYALVLLMLVAAVAIFGEIVPMARGNSAPRDGEE